MDRRVQQDINGKSPTKWTKVSVQPIVSLNNLFELF